MAYLTQISDDNYIYSYSGVSGSILKEYLTPAGIEAYLYDESFSETVRQSYIFCRDTELGQKEGGLENPKKTTPLNGCGDRCAICAPIVHSRECPSSRIKTTFRGSVNHAEPKSRSEKMFFPK